MTVVQSGIQTQLLKQFWHDTFLEEFRANLVLADLAVKGTVNANEGKLCHWLALADMTAASTISEGYDPTGYALSAGDLTANLTQYGGKVVFSDLMKDTWVKDGLKTVIERCARQAALTIDTAVLAIFSGGGLAQYAGTAVARNSIPADSTFTFDVAELREAVCTLGKANATKYNNDHYVGVIHPDCKYDLQGDSAWTGAHTYVEKGIEKIYKGEAGTLYGTKFVESTQALMMSNSGSANADVYQTYIVGDNYFGKSDLKGIEIIVKDPSPTSDLDLVSSVGWKALFALKELKASGMVRVESWATLGS